ncbi:unnamed protein product [Parnassius mnemosyne]|uniref:Uncharacterized protein n=1 Tax=Parnassius mnemosyne TaxID=213953 RepID=A0AAV1KVQ6_9NEOP
MIFSNVNSKACHAKRGDRRSGARQCEEQDEVMAAESSIRVRRAAIPAAGVRRVTETSGRVTKIVRNNKRKTDHGVRSEEEMRNTITAVLEDKMKIASSKNMFSQVKYARKKGENLSKEY